MEKCYHALKKPISSKFLFSHQILHFMQWTLAKKLFDLDKKRFCYKSLKTWKSYFLGVYPCLWSHDRHAQSCHVDLGKCALRLDLIRLFYLCKFSFVDDAKCFFPALSMSCQVKFTEVKQARWAKPEILNVRHNSFKRKGRLMRRVDQNGGKFVRFFAKGHWVIYKIR